MTELQPIPQIPLRDIHRPFVQVVTLCSLSELSEPDGYLGDAVLVEGIGLTEHWDSHQKQSVLQITIPKVPMIVWSNRGGNIYQPRTEESADKIIRVGTALPSEYEVYQPDSDNPRGPVVGYVGWELSIEYLGRVDITPEGRRRINGQGIGPRRSETTLLIRSTRAIQEPEDHVGQNHVDDYVRHSDRWGARDANDAQ